MSSIITAVTSVFTAVGEWFGGAVQAMIPIFYTAEDGLTFIGTLTIMGLSISVTFLLLNVISSFLQFRG